MTAERGGRPSNAASAIASSGSSRRRCAATGSRASATASTSATRGRARATTRGSGTGTPASTRSSGAASTAPAPRASSAACWPAAPTTASSATRSSGTATSTGSAAGPTTSPRERSEHLHDPAAAARLGLADRGRRPGRRAADRRPPPLARGEPGPGRRRAALDRPARRVGARLLAEVRPGLGPARPRPAAVSLPDRQEPAPRLGRAAGPRRRRAGALRGGHQRALVPRPDRRRRALDHPADRRSPLGRATRALPRRRAGQARPRGQDRPAAGGDRRIRTSTWSALAPLALPDLPEEIGRRLVEEHLLDPAQLLAALPADLGLGGGAHLRAAQVEGPVLAPSTGAARPGSTRPGCSGSACAGSATRPRRWRWPSGSATPWLRERLREFYEPYTGEGLGAKEFGWSSLIAELADPDPVRAWSYLD